MSEGTTSGRYNAPFGYLGAVAAATISFVAAEIARHAMDLGLSFLRPDLLLVELFSTLVIALLFAPIAGVTALVPFLGVRKIAECFGIRSGWYYAVCGAATGFTLTPLGVVLLSASPTLPGLDPDLEPTLWQGLMTLGPFFVLSGAVGGLTYWWISIKRP